VASPLSPRRHSRRGCCFSARSGGDNWSERCLCRRERRTAQTGRRSTCSSPNPSLLISAQDEARGTWFHVNPEGLAGASAAGRLPVPPRLTGAPPPEPPHPRDDRIPGERSSRPATSRRCLCHGRERPRRPTLTIASTIHATRAGRSPPTDRARREPASRRSGTGAVSGARFSRIAQLRSTDSAGVPIRLVPM
jgi:hypothetical protein